jgi:CDP-diacylglycerol--serine O-phosphatidyltransferase
VLEVGGKVKSPVLSGLFAALVLASSALMVSRVRYRSFKEFGVRHRNPFRVIVPIGVLIAAVLLHPPLLLLVAIYAYLLSGVATALIPKRLLARGRSAEPGPAPLDGAEKGIASSAP